MFAFICGSHQFIEDEKDRKRALEEHHKMKRLAWKCSPHNPAILKHHIDESIPDHHVSSLLFVEGRNPCAATCEITWDGGAVTGFAISPVHIATCEEPIPSDAELTITFLGSEPIRNVSLPAVRIFPDRSKFADACVHFLDFQILELAGLKFDFYIPLAQDVNGHAYPALDEVKMPTFQFDPKGKTPYSRLLPVNVLFVDEGKGKHSPGLILGVDGFEICHTAQMFPGMAGAPLVDSELNLIGIQRGGTDIDGYNWGVALDAILSVAFGAHDKYPQFCAEKHPECQKVYTTLKWACRE